MRLLLFLLSHAFECVSKHLKDGAVAYFVNDVAFGLSDDPRVAYGPAAIRSDWFQGDFALKAKRDGAVAAGVSVEEQCGLWGVECCAGKTAECDAPACGSIPIFQPVLVSDTFG